MTAFYYVAVSNSAKRKVVGKVEAASEKEAREELNKMGLAILTLSSEQLTDWSAADAFEFASMDATGKKIEGEIDAKSAEQAYDRLATELGLDPKYICKASASEEEKAKARETSVKEILAKKAQAQKIKKDAEMRTISGGLKSLVRLAEGEHKDMAAEKNSQKFSNGGDGDLDKKTEADFMKPEQKESQDKPKVEADPKAKIKEGSAGSSHQTPVEASEEEQDAGSRFQNFRRELSTFFPGFRKKLGELYFHLTEIIVPPEGKTRKDALGKIWNLIFPPKPVKVMTTPSKEGFFSPMHRKAVLQRFWIVAENVSDVLAAIFLSYLAVGFIALRFEMGVLTELAEKTLPGNLLIPFLAFVFIFFRVLIFIRDKWTSWSAWRTSLLFAAGSVAVVFVGINFL